MIKRLKSSLLSLAFLCVSGMIVYPSLTQTVVAAENFLSVKDGKLLENEKETKKTGNFTVNGKVFYVRNGLVYGEVVNVEKGWYEIHSAIKDKTNFCIDVSGAGFKGGPEKGKGDGNIHVFQDNNSIAQRFLFTPLGGGLYNITTGTGDHAKRIDVVSGKKGANIRQWQSNNSNAQKFRVVRVSDGSISFINEATGQALDIEGNDNLVNLQNVWDYPFMFGKDKGQTFKLQKIANEKEMPKNTSKLKSGWYRIQPSKNTKFSLDISGDRVGDGVNVQLYQNNNTKAQMFYIKNLGSGEYQILTGTTNASAALDVSATHKGNVQQYSKHGGANQRWKLYGYKDGTYGLVSSKDGKVLDVAGANVYKNNVNVWTWDFLRASNGLAAAEGQGFKLTKLNNKPTGWMGDKYIKEGTVQKGLQKIGNTWYLFNKGTGKKEQSGDKIRVGSYFQTQTNHYNRFFITLDGTNFVYSKNFTPVKGRDMNFLAKNGVFYGLRTAANNPVNTKKYLLGKTYKGPAYDFAILATNNFKKYNWHSITDAYVKTNQAERWAPEWFEDNGKTYVFYSVNKGNYRGKANEDTTFTIYRTQATDLKNYKFTKPVEMKFNVFPKFLKASDYGEKHGTDWVRGFIDASVVKNGNTYVMFVKDEHQTLGNARRGEAIWVYTSKDLTNWNFWYKMPKSALPQTAIKVNGKTYNRYWEGQNVVKIGDTWHFYADEMTYNTAYNNGWWWKDDNANAADTYTGRFIHLTSKDLRNWTNKGYINTGNMKIRHGSVMTVNDAKSEAVIQSLFNK